MKDEMMSKEGERVERETMQRITENEQMIQKETFPEQLYANLPRPNPHPP